MLPEYKKILAQTDNIFMLYSNKTTHHQDFSLLFQ